MRLAHLALPPGVEPVGPTDLTGGRQVPTEPAARHAPAEPAGEAGPGRTGSRWARVVGALADQVPPTLRGARWQLSGRAVAAVVVVIAVAVGSAVLVAGQAAPEMIIPGSVTVTTSPVAVDPGADPPSGAPPSPSSASSVVVHVAGLVAKPGVFELPAGSRVVEALAAAGGALPDVDTSTLNLARVLVDGEQIAVGVPPAPDAGGGLLGGGATAEPGQPLDLNTATEAQLDALPGVGPVLAGRIIAWREDHGAFTAVEELLEVSGIGTATLADLSGLVRV